MADTKTPVEELEGRDLDAAVAEEVMGKQVTWVADGEPHAWSGVGSEPGFQESTKVPAYSTDIAAAWKVVEEISKTWGVEIKRIHRIEAVEGPTKWLCQIGELIDFDPIHVAEAESAPLAICRAALKAVRQA